MNIVFFSTSAVHFEKEKLKVTQIPSCKENFDAIVKRFPEHKFFCVTQKPGDFLLDLDGSELKEKCEGVTYIVDSGISAEDTAAAVMKCSPDVAIAATFWNVPFDWQGMKDSMTAEILERNGVKVFAHPVKSSLVCFDKARTHEVLQKTGIDVAPSVYVNHQLFWCAGNKGKVRENVYKDSVLFEIAKLKFPVVIKDTTGLSSYGMEVCTSFDEVKRFLCSKRNNSDRVVEQLICGQQFGTEVYCRERNCVVFNPLEFSVNKYGITSPKLSIKKGPVTDEKYKIGELKKLLQKIADELKLNGVFQVDLVFSEGKWFVIEINPRLSGMSWTYAAALKKSPLELLLENALGLLNENQVCREMMYTVNFKLPLQDEGTLKDISVRNHVCYVHQIENLAARQEREKGYLEVVLCSDDMADIEKEYVSIKSEFDKVS